MDEAEDREKEKLLASVIEGEKALALMQAELEFTDPTSERILQIEIAKKMFMPAHEAAVAIYERASGQKFESKIPIYVEQLRKKLVQ